MEVLERLLSDLYACLPGSSDSEGSGADSKAIIDSIDNVVFSESIGDEFDQEFVMDLLFRSDMPPCLFKFLNHENAVRSKDKIIVQTKIAVMKFISSYIKYSGVAISSVSGAVFANVYDLYRREESREFKAACLLPVKKILSVALLVKGESGTEIDGAEVNTAVDVGGDAVIGDGVGAGFSIPPSSGSLADLYANLLAELGAKKQSKGGRCEILKVLGLLVRLYPDCEATVAAEPKLQEACDKLLRASFGGAGEPDFPAIAGCFSCLDRCLFDFEVRYANSPQLWGWLLQAVTALRAEDTHRYAIVAKALRLIKNHAGLFRSVIAENISQTYEQIESCVLADKASVAKHAEGALLGVLTQTALHIVDCRRQGWAADPEAASRFLNDLSARLLLRLSAEQVGAETSVATVTLALKSIAAIAPGLTFYSSDSGAGKANPVDGVLSVLVQAADQNISSLFNNLAAKSQESGAYGSVVAAERKLLFLLAVSSAIHATDGGGADDVSVFVLRTVPEVVLQFPYLSDKYKALLSHCLCLLLQGASRTDVAVVARQQGHPATVANSLLADVLEVLVSCLLARSLSVVDAVDTPAEDGRLYGAYAGLWADLIAPTQGSTRVAVACAEPPYTVCAGRLCDALFSHWLELLASLDLSTIPAPPGDARSDGGEEGASLVATNPADQELLLNFASLMELLLPKVLQLQDAGAPGNGGGTCVRRLQYWINALLDQCMALATASPMVSPLYRLARLLLVAGEACLRYVSGVVGEDGEMHLPVGAVDGDAGVGNIEELEIAQEQLAVLSRLRAFLGATVRHQLASFRDELLDRALALLFEAPRGAIGLEELLPAVVVSLASERQVGAAVVCLTQSIGDPVLDGHLPRLLPLLNKFLLTSYADKAGAGGTDLKEVSLKRAAGATRRRSQQAQSGSSVQQGAELQHAILVFLGRLGGKNKLMLPAPQEVLRSALHWSQDAPVLLSMACVADASVVQLPVDLLLPRVVELCQQSGDPAARVMAAEALHGILSFMVGSAATSPTRGRVGVESAFAAHYRNIFPVILRLASSPTSVCRQLFTWQLFQLIHWFSGVNQVHPDEARELVNALVEGLCGTDNSARELSCQGLVEFVRWAVKQSSKAELAVRPLPGENGSPSSVHSLLERLLVLAAHPAEQRRLGAALVLGRIHMHLREESALVAGYAMRIVHSLLKALKLCVQVSVDGGAGAAPVGGGISLSSSSRLRDEIIQAVDRYEAVIVRLASDPASRAVVGLTDKGFVSRLHAASCSQSVPPACARTEFPYFLHELVDWLWSFVAYPDPHFRRCCMKAFGALCPLLFLDADDATALPAQVLVAKYVGSKASRAAAGLPACASRSKSLKRGGQLAESAAASPSSSSSEPVEELRAALFSATRVNRTGSGSAAGRLQTELLMSVDAHVDVYNWLYKLRYLDAAQLAMLLQPAVGVDSGTSGASSPSPPAAGGSKKRKATDMDEEGADFGQKLAAVSVMGDVRDFLLSCREPFADGVAAEGMPELRAEVLRRVLQFLCTLFTPRADSGLALDSTLAVEALAVWTQCSLSQLIVDALMCPGQINRSGARTASGAPHRTFFPDSTQSSVISVQIPQQIQQLLALCWAYGNSGTSSGAASMRRIMVGLCAALQTSLYEALDNMVQLESSQEEVQCCARAVTVVRGAGLMEAVFRAEAGGASQESEELLLEYGFRVLQAASLLTEHASVKQVQVGRLYLELAVAFGVPFASPAATIDETEAAGCYSFMQVLTLTDTGDEACLALFVERYLDVLAEQSLLGGRACALFARNAPPLIAAYCGGQAAVGSCAERGRVLLSRLLHRALTLLLVYSDADSLGATEQASVKRDAVRCFRDASDGFRRLPPAMLLQVLELDSSIGDPAARSAELRAFVSESCLAILPRSADVEQLSAHLRYLAYVLPGCAQTCPVPLTAAMGGNLGSATLEDQVVAALEEMVANHFPLKPVPPVAGTKSVAWENFSVLLRVYLEVLASVGAVCLLQPLIPSFRLGRAHHYWAWISAALKQMVDAVDTNGSGTGASAEFPSLQALYRTCIDVMLDEGENVPVKRTFFDDICIPLLRRAPDAGLIGIFASPIGGGSAPSCIVKQLVETVQKPGAASEAMSLSDSLPGGTPSPLQEAARTSAYVQGCAFTLLATVFDRCALASVKGELTTAFCHAGLEADAPRPAVTGKELTVAICRVAHKAVRTVKVQSLGTSGAGATLGEAVSEAQAIQQQLWSSAYNCLCTVVAKTQLDEQFYDKFLFKEQATDLFWCHVIDTCSKEFRVLSSAPERFVVTKLGRGASSFESSHTVSAAARGAWARTGGLMSQYFSDSILGSCSLAMGKGAGQKGGFVGGNMTNWSNTIGDGSMASQLLTSDSYCYESSQVSAAPHSGGPNAMVVDSSGSIGSDLSSGGGGAGIESDLARGWDDCVIEFELSDVNRQPCMSVLVRLVQRMWTLFRERWEAADSAALPVWLAVCKDKLCDYSSISGHASVRVFMLRLLLNQPVASIVRKWAQELLPGALECCLRDLCVTSDNGPGYGDGDDNPGCSYFLRDVVQTLTTEWAAASLTTDSARLASRLLSYMLRRVFHPVPAVLRQSSRAVKDLLLLWAGRPAAGGKAVDDVDLAPIADLLSEAAGPTGGAHARASSRGSESVRKRLVGLELVMVLLQCGYPVLSARTHGSCAERLLAGVLSSIAYPRREVAEFACLVAGLVLEAIDKNKAAAAATTGAGRRHGGATAAVPVRGGEVLIRDCEGFRAQVDAQLAALFKQKDGADLVATCLRALTTTRPLGRARAGAGSGSDYLRRDMVLKMTSLFARLKPRGRMDLLEALVQTRSSFEGLSVPGCLRPFMLSLLADMSSVVIGRGAASQRLPLVQLLALRLLSRHASELPVDYVRMVFGASPAEGLQLTTGEHSVLQVREEGYCVLMRLCDRFAAAGGQPGSSGADPALLRALRRLLLRGLMDPDTDGMEVTAAATAGAQGAAAAAVASSSSADAEPNPRIGIRRFVFEYCNSTFGLGDAPIDRLNSLLRDLFDATGDSGVLAGSGGAADNWVFYAGYLLVAAYQKGQGYSSRIFSTSLADEGSYAPLHLSTGAGGSRGAQTDLSSLPMFALERTQSQLGSRADADRAWVQTQTQTQTQSQWLSSAALGSGGSSSALTTQSVDRRKHRRQGFLRASQERSWTQTQVAASRAANLPGDEDRRGTNGAFFVQRLLNSNWSQQVPAATATTAAATAAAGAMAAPVGLPKYITQRRASSSAPRRQRASGTLSSLATFSQSFSTLGATQLQVAEDESLTADLLVGDEGAGQADADKGKPLRGRASAYRFSRAGAAAKKKKVVLYRAYRAGELPDISVSPASIVAPLQGAMARDAGLATAVMTQLFARLYGEPPAGAAVSVESLNNPQSVELRRNLVAALKALAASARADAAGGSSGSTASGGSCVAVLLAACAHGIKCELSVLSPIAPGAGETGAGSGRRAGGAAHRTGAAHAEVQSSLLSTLPVAEVADLGISSGSHHAAIRLLEEHLRLAEAAAGADHASGASAFVWVQLSRLYAALAEEEIVLGIVGRVEASAEAGAESDTDTEVDEGAGEEGDGDAGAESGAGGSGSRICRAIDCEAAGRYGDAIDLYRRLMLDADAANAAAKAVEYGGGAAAATQQQAGDVRAAQAEMWEARSVRCMYRLLDWGAVHAHVDAQVPDVLPGLPSQSQAPSQSMPRRLLSMPDPRRRDLLAGHYLRSLVHCCAARPEGIGDADTSAARAELDELLDTAASVGGLVRGLAKELAMASALRGEWVKAKSHALAGLEVFSVSWSSMSACALAAKRGLLGDLQALVELEQLASAHIRTAAAAPALAVARRQTGTGTATGGSGGSLQLARGMARLLHSWAPSAPSMTDPLCAWDSVAGARHLAFDHLRRQAALLQSGAAVTDAQSAGRLLQPAAAHLVSLHVAAGMAAVRQQVLPVVRTQLSLANMIRNGVAGSSSELTLGEVRVVYRYNGQHIANELAAGGATAPQVKTKFEQNIRLLDSKAAQLAQQLAAAPQAQAALQEAAEVTLLRAAWHARWSRCPVFDGASRRSNQQQALDIYRGLVERPAAALVSAARVTRADNEQRRRAYGQLARHAHAMLHIDLDAEREAAAVTEPSAGPELDLEVARVALRSFACGLRLGDAYCRDHVMLFLDLLGRHPGAEGEFTEQLPHTPRWLFLRLAPQLMGRMDRPEGGAAAQILAHVAQEHPEALFYPFKITSEFLGSRGTANAAALRPLLQNSTLDTFVASLGGLTHPHHRWGDGLKAITKVLEAAGTSAGASVGGETRATVLAMFAALKAETTHLAWDRVGSKIGDYNVRWARAHRAAIDKLAGPAGEKLFDDKVLTALAAGKFLQPNEHDSGRAPLAAFSTWLTETFDPALHRIPVPAQAHGQAHGQGECVVGFDPQLLVMSSVRKPKRLRVYTSHGRELSFLVKGGEDLRNDERVQQLFGLMNDIVAGGAAADDADADAAGDTVEHGWADSQLRARTFEVVPMTSRVGLLEWVSCTVPIKSVVQEEMGRCPDFRRANPAAFTKAGGAAAATATSPATLSAIAATSLWYKWLTDTGPGYQKMMVRASAAAAARKFREVQALVPQDMLRRRLLALAPSAESFVALRTEFATTLAVSSAFGYVLGLADRHLDNLLLDTSSGAVVQIDFGYCFGMGHSALPVPELLPFRLSAQLRGVLLPLDGAVLLRGHMRTCLERLRSPRGVDVLANALEIYVDDPVVDWLKDAGSMPQPNQSLGSGGESGGESTFDKDALAQLAQEPAWEPRRRITNALRKLRGEHPVDIMSDELRCNRNISGRVLAAYLATIEAVRGRGQARGAALSPGEQASVLINLATDPNILARQFVGLLCWV